MHINECRISLECDIHGNVVLHPEEVPTVSYSIP